MTITTLNQESLDLLFNNARTANGFTEQAIAPDLMQQVYALARMPPTSMNTQPTRYVFLASAESRARLLPSLMGSNVEKTRLAPMTVIVATDSQFYLNMPKIWHDPNGQKLFENSPALTLGTAARNGTLSGAYFIMAARALGLDCGPMSGFDIAKVNAEFFSDGRWHANFLINLGYADHSKEMPRNPRLSFDEACRVL